MAELLEATKKMMKYFKRSLKHIPLQPNNTSHADKHKHTSHYHKDEVSEITPNTYTPKHITTETDDILDSSNVDSSDSTTNSTSDSK